MFLDRLLDRVKDETGVSFKEFRDFCQFLNNLEDFSIAMRMYTLADHPISKGRNALLISDLMKIANINIFQMNSLELLKFVPD